MLWLPAIYFDMPKALYLRVIPGTLTTRYSNSASVARRAGQLRHFLLDKQLTLEQHLPAREVAKLELWVLSRRDWSQLTSRPYGLAFLHQQVIVAPAAYHPGLIERLDSILLEAASHGLRAPGEVRELFDLLIAYVWCKAALKILGYPQRQRQLGAAYLLHLVLQSEENLLQKLLQWARILARSEPSGVLKDLGVAAQHLLQVQAPSWQDLSNPKRVASLKLDVLDSQE